MLMKKGILFALVALLAPFANAAKTITPKTPALVDDCYEISSAEELYGFASLVNSGDSDFTGCAKLTADIVVNEGVLTEDDSLNVADTVNFVVWKPINRFGGGVFDGQGHTVSGLYRDYYNSEIDWIAAGFFERLGDDGNLTTVVRNLSIKDSFFGAHSQAGAIAGVIYTEHGYVIIENCSIHARIETKEFYHHAGGIVGEVDGHATIKDCSASGILIGSGNNMGGIVGDIAIEKVPMKDQPVQVLNCSSKVHVSGVPSRAGGIVGHINGWTWIKNAKNYGEVVGDTVGGIAGSASGSITVVNSLNEASVVNGKYVAGGIVGILGGAAIVMNCYNKGAVSSPYGSSSVGGLFGRVTSCRYIAGAYSVYQIENSGYREYQHALIGGFKGISYKALASVMENVFYLDSESGKKDSVGKAIPAELFEDGTVAYMLRNFTYRVSSFDGSVWGQDVGTDPYPVFKDAITGMTSSAMAALILHTYEGDTLVYPDKYVPGYEFSLPYVNRDSYVFQGWYENEELTGDTVISILADSEGDREFWAKLSKICNITYNAVGGVVDTNVATSYVEGTGLTLTRKISRDGYVFAGWYTDSEYSGEPVAEITAAETGNKVFYAKWIKKEIPLKDADGCYVIKTAMELYGFAAIVGGTDGVEREHYACGSLANDIVVNQDVIDENGMLNEAEKHKFLEWTPIVEFAGVFDGKFHSVSGLYFNDSLDDKRRGTGFFASVDKRGNYIDVVVKNLGIEKSYFAARDLVGALMGRTIHYEYVAQGGIQVLNCYSTSTVHSYEQGSGEIGASGLVGGDVGATDLYIENSYNAGRIEHRGTYGGGLVGWKHYYEKKNYLTIVNSYNIGPVLDLYTGAITYDLIGENDERTTIENSYYQEYKNDAGWCDVSHAEAENAIHWLLKSAVVG